MIAPPCFRVMRGPLVRTLGWLLLVELALLAVPSAFAGDRPDLDTFILTGPPDFTSSTTADFTFESNAVGEHGYWCKLDDEEEVPCDDGTWQRVGLAPGPHEVWVYAYEVQPRRVDTSPASWVWEVLEAPPPLDAGSPGGDGGVPGGDAGSPADDGGTSGSDAGPGGGDGGAAETDAGPGGSDGGTSGSDAGPGDEDGGARGDEDGGTSGEDAGPAGEDGGTTPDGDAGQEPSGDATPPDSLDYLGAGMGCTGAPAPAALAGLMLLVLALHRRRGRG